MNQIQIKIPHVKWRGGKPFFNPSRRLRDAGWKSQNLRHGRTGPWYSLSECQSFLDNVSSQTEVREAHNPKPRPVRKVGLSIGTMWEQCRARPEFRGEEISKGRRQRKALARKTVQQYSEMLARLAKFDPELWDLHPKALTPKRLEATLEAIEEIHGLPTAHAIKRALSAVYGRMAVRLDLDHNPCSKVTLPAPEPRVRAGSILEMQHLVKTACQMDQADIALSIMLGLMTGQRQSDRLRLTGGQVVPDNEFGEAYIFRQLKTGAIAMVPAVPDLKKHLDWCRERRCDDLPELVIDERRQIAFSETDNSHYGKLFRLVRTEAASSMPSLADFRDQDLRDTAVTWLARAQCTVPQIAAITGHTEKSISGILKHYLARHPDLARDAIRNLSGWLESNGANL